MSSPPNGRGEQTTGKSAKKEYRLIGDFINTIDPEADSDGNCPTGRASILTILDSIHDRRACSILHTRLTRAVRRAGKPPLTMQASSLGKILQSQKETVEAVPLNKEAHAVFQIYRRLPRKT
jgi:hypothetical protein